MDEPKSDSSAFEDILPSLIDATSETGPLMMEITRGRTSEKRGSEEKTGESKKLTGDYQSNRTGSQATKEIVDRGSRAQRCHDQTY